MSSYSTSRCVLVTKPFTAPGGHVLIAAAQDPKRNTTIRITDNGCGMSQKEIANALIPFGGTGLNKPRANSDTGLGLPLSKMLIELHGGKFDVESMPERGTTIIMVIPEPAS